MERVLLETNLMKLKIELGVIKYGVAYIEHGRMSHFIIYGGWVLGRRDTIRPEHAEILRLRPYLQEWVDMHLSDAQGLPMYAVDNGWYFAGGAYWRKDPPDPQALSKLLRIGLPEALQLIARVKGGMTKDGVRASVDSQRPRYLEEARVLLRKLGYSEEGNWTVRHF